MASYTDQIEVGPFKLKTTIDYHYEEGRSYIIIDEAWLTRTGDRILLLDDEREYHETEVYTKNYWYDIDADAEFWAEHDARYS